MSRIIGVIVLLNLFGSTFAFFEGCDQTFNLQLGESRQINSPNYPSRYPAGSSCKYKITAPSGTQIQLKCQIQMTTTSSGACRDKFYIASDGILNLSNSEYVCGNGSITRDSVYSELTAAYTSITTGAFTCKTTVKAAPCDCGWSVSTRIVGGVDALVNEYTSLVGLVNLQNSMIFCGGTIISTTMVLTAASCLSMHNNPTRVGVLAGDLYYTIGVSGTETPYTKLYAAKKLIVHPMYKSTSQDNDIGLIETTTQILFSRGVGPACLPFLFTSQSFENTAVEAAGWGTTSFAGPASSNLKKVSLTVISNTKCGQSYSQIISQSKLCTYTPGKDTCQYDVGGPLYSRGNRLYVVGIVSYGTGCGMSTPTVNTRVTSYLDWIVANANSATFCRK
ncbi:hypothetical protein HA402_004146 [Bradysia odoriphaga]|nr:hypothetical protein HA402_004146 [Bradysia odoriphaga]